MLAHRSAAGPSDDGLAGDGTALPPGLEDLPELSVSDVAVVFVGAGVDSIGATLATARPIELPDPVDLTVERVSLTVSVEHPGDAATRVVTITAEGSTSFADAELAVRVERGEDGWTLSGGLAEAPS